MLNDFNALLKNGNIGFYTKCEVIEIFGFDNTIKKPFNIFTLITFEDSKQINIEELLTEKLEKFQSIQNLKWGIKRRIIDIDSAKIFFANLLEHKKYTFNDKDESNIGQLNCLTKQFIEMSESLNNPQINNVLKNNFHNGSYIIEAFDETKVHVKFLLNDPVLLNDFSERVNTILPLRIGNVSDRLGNVIFQFPINLFRLHYSLPRNTKGVQFDFSFHPKLRRKLKLQTIVQNIFDGSILDFKIKTITNNDFIDVSTSENINIILIDKKTDSTVYKNSLNTIESIMFNLGIMSNQSRHFNVAGHHVELAVAHNQSLKYNNHKKNITQYTTWIRNRKYEHERKELEQSKSFIQYFGSQKAQALGDIRYLIQHYGQNGVYIWDPYLSAEDIKNTLYYSTVSNATLKAITGLKQHNDKQQVINDIQNELAKDNQQYLFLNLEIRGKIGHHGYDFHDRFIIFPLEKPQVWSLGISVNQIGDSHHILHEVKNAQHILNAFNRLWDELNHQECLVWKSI